MTMLLIANAIVFGILFAIWSSKGWFNWFIKLTMFCMFLFNGLHLLHALGYIIKA